MAVAMAVVEARARAVARTNLSAAMVARAVELWWSGCGLVVARARALAVELRWSGSGFMVARARPLCGSSFVVAQRQRPAWRRRRQLYFSAALAAMAAVASLAAA